MIQCRLFSDPGGNTVGRACTERTAVDSIKDASTEAVAMDRVGDWKPGDCKPAFECRLGEPIVSGTKLCGGVLGTGVARGNGASDIGTAKDDGWALDLSLEAIVLERLQGAEGGLKTLTEASITSLSAWLMSFD